MDDPASAANAPLDRTDDEAPPAGASMEERRRWFSERYKDGSADENARFERLGNRNEGFRSR